MRPNSSGFTLIELLTTVAVCCIVALALMISASHLLMTVAAGNQDAQAMTIMESVNSAFADDKDHCTSILGGKELDMAQPTGSSVLAIDLHDHSGAPGQTIVKAGELAPGSSLTVDDIRLVPIASVGSTAIVAQLELHMSKRNVLGPSKIKRTLPVYASTRNGKVVGCSTSPLPFEAISQRICELKSDGFALYDPVADKCVDRPEVRIFSNGTDIATCGPGYRPAASPLNPDAVDVACEAPAMGGIAAPPRTYTNGMTDSGNLEVFNGTLDYASATCKYAAATNADAATVVRIKCVAVN